MKILNIICFIIDLLLIIWQGFCIFFIDDSYNIFEDKKYQWILFLIYFLFGVIFALNINK